MIPFTIIPFIFTATLDWEREIAAVDAHSRTEGVEVAWGLNVIRGLVNDERNTCVLASECELNGFRDDTRSEYKERSVVSTEAAGRITLTAPKVGDAYLAFVLYDSDGTEKIGLYINGIQKGIAVADVDNNRNHVFTLATPYSFTGGEEIVLQTGTSEGMYRIEKLLFLHEKPPAGERAYTITETYAEPLFRPDGSVQARMTWLSSWPTSTQVEYGLEAEAVQAAETEVPAPQNNHRVILDGLERDKTYHYRIIAETPDGERVDTPTLTFNTTPIPTVETETPRKQVALTLENRIPYPRCGWPVTSGIPFPKGELASTEHIRILNPDGAEIPSQVAPLTKWLDGSIKWALLDFQADVPKGSTAIYTLEYGTDVQSVASTEGNTGSHSRPRLDVVDNGDSVTVDTGALQFAIHRNQSFSPLQSQLTAIDGTVYDSLGTPDKVQIEESGPMRTAIRVEGTHKNDAGESLFAYIVTIHAYAGKSYTRVFYTFGNNHYDAEFTSIQSLQLELPLDGIVEPGERLTHAYGSDEESGSVVTGSLDTIPHVELYQKYDDSYQARGAVYVSQSGGKRAAGWLDVNDGVRGLTVAVRHFWQQYPKSLAIGDHTLKIGICPPITGKEYAGFLPKHQDQLYYYLQDDLYKFKLGVTKRHELFFYAHEGDIVDGEVEAQVAAFQQPLLAVAPAAWYCGSGAFSDLMPAEASAFPEYDKMMKQSLAKYLEEREQDDAYGMLNFGDWWGERGYNWGNIEYDTQHALLLQYIRTGDQQFFEVAESAARHNMDVDTVHYHHAPFRVGGQYTHCMGHVGGYDWVGPTAITQGSFSVSHSWVEGLLEYYCLTGDRRAVETAQLIADLYNTRDLRNYDFTNCRIPGWHLIMTMAMFNATNDRYYLNAAKIIVERVLERQTPDEPPVEGGRLNGGWTRLMVPGHCHCDPPRHIGNAGFMVGILLAGLKAYHQATGDKSVEEAIIRAAHYLVRDVWEPEVDGFRYTSCPDSSKGTGNIRKLLGISYAYRLTGDERLGAVARRGTAAGIRSLSGSGKGLSAHGRFAPYVLHDVQVGDD